MDANEIRKEMWNKRINEQREDFKTKAIREDVNLFLSDKEYANLQLRAYKAGLSNLGDIISAFVGDLTGCFQNGSDEATKADEWYERTFGMCEYHYFFKYHLFNYSFILDDMAEMVEDENFFEDTYQTYIAEASGLTIESKEQCLETLKEIIENGKEL